MIKLIFTYIFIFILFTCQAQEFNEASDKLNISGVFPHLAVFNEGDGTPCNGNGNEIGIGAVVPWQGKLWMITYSPHCPNGSSDKLYAVDDNLDLSILPESVGGTPAGRMIHKESNQLIIGPYIIDENQKIKVLDPKVMPGRITAIMRHLKDPANWVYVYDMEGALYEANVHTLEVHKLYDKPIPGWHGKGGYTAQNRVIISNNGEHETFDIDPAQLEAGGAPQSKEDMGALAEWDGKNWNMIARRQFTDVTGPGGIYGSEDANAPVWSIGWDKRSVILKLLDNGNWYTYRLPKSTHAYDHWGGWYTEWPRIREVTDGKWLMDMHGMFYDFPPTFSHDNSGGIQPISNHLRYVPDFCAWNDKLVLSTDETSILQNPYAGRSQSNLWFGDWDDLKDWGATNGWGGPWMNDEVKAGKASDPYLIGGFDQKVLHLQHNADKAITFTLQIDKKGDNQWEDYKTIKVPAKGYQFEILPQNLQATWMRFKTDQNCQATAFFHYTAVGHDTAERNELFAALADIDEDDAVVAGVIRPAAYNKSLQFVDLSDLEKTYYEINESLQYENGPDSLKEKVIDICTLEKDFEIDEASIIIKDKSGTYRLPKTSAEYDEAFAAGWPRGIREIESERYMMNAHGTFYEFPREAGFSSIRPITTHEKKIQDFCTWRGLLVMSGTKKDAEQDGQYFSTTDKQSGLWFGAVDDLWKLGKPVGEGGPWKDAQIKANEPSLPYLMTGYDKKKLELTFDQEATFTIQVDFDHEGWVNYKTITAKANEKVTHEFPEGFSAHWIRLVSDHDGKATAWFIYE